MKWRGLDKGAGADRQRCAPVGLLIALIAVALGAQSGRAAGGGGADLDPFEPNLEDLPSLQRGMTYYVNYCLGCHSLKFQRYERTARDLGIPADIALDNLVFTGAAIGSLMETAMPAEGAKNWFGAAPPDLTMVDRVRGTAWVYNMLKGFYADPERPFGVNNRVFENIAMPHVLAGLQGVPELVCKGKKPVDLLAGRSVLRRDANGEIVREDNCSWTRPAPGTGSLTAGEFDQVAKDLANFLHYVGEPGRQERRRIGVWVLAFLGLLFGLATLLNREYWKDVH